MRFGPIHVDADKFPAGILQDVNLEQRVLMCQVTVVTNKGNAIGYVSKLIVRRGDVNIWFDVTDYTDWLLYWEPGAKMILKPSTVSLGNHQRLLRFEVIGV